MAETIWKFPLEIIDRQEVEMPEDFAVLHVGFQNGQLCMWGTVSEESPKDTVGIRIVGTGHQIQDPDDLIYIGTVLTANESLVWHIFMEEK